MTKLKYLHSSKQGNPHECKLLLVQRQRSAHNFNTVAAVLTIKLIMGQKAYCSLRVVFLNSSEFALQELRIESTTPNRVGRSTDIL